MSTRTSGWSTGDIVIEGWPAIRMHMGTRELVRRGDWGGPLVCGDGYDWHHVVFIFDGPGKRIESYVDGELVPWATTKNATTRKHEVVQPDDWSVTSSDTTGLTIGRCNHSAKHCQVLDEVAVWNRPLSKEEVTALFHGGYGIELTTVTTSR